jgi:iron complex transport system substrate-binding protein
MIGGLKSCLNALATLLATATLLPGPAAAEPGSKPRIVSINVCTDQLLLALADPDQILGLSPFSRSTVRSWAAEKAGRYRRLSGDAEDVLTLRPDIVVAGRFSRFATRELLKQKGIPVIDFDVAGSLDDARTQIRRMGELADQPDRAAAAIARLDAAVVRARAAASHVRMSVLPLARRGWVAGDDSLMSSLLESAGLTNAAGRLGRIRSGFASLEAIIGAHPDLLLVTDDSAFAEDQGRAFLLHPALERLYPLERRLIIPERLTVCGGPMLAEALDRLAVEIERIGR